MYSLFLVIIAIIPSIALFYFVYHKDAIEKEPFYLLIVLFCLGILGTLLSININQFLKNHFFFLNVPSENWSFLENLLSLQYGKIKILIIHMMVFYMP